ncbi:hypothetical protein [Wolbachia endosymbiont (group A) of Icerya purchasi]|nr:hypothetical protein [Wolbachia endosymbiont (group A) of Icerya purchasi]
MEDKANDSQKTLLMTLFWEFGNVQKSVSNRIFNSTQFSICRERRYQVEI